MASTLYVVRLSSSPARSEPSYLYPPQSGYASGGNRQKAIRLSRAEACEAAARMEARIRAYYAGEGRECPTVYIDVVPASGGAACNRHRS